MKAKDTKEYVINKTDICYTPIDKIDTSNEKIENFETSHLDLVDSSQNPYLCPLTKYPNETVYPII